jgi:hypothetical protein
VAARLKVRVFVVSNGSRPIRPPRMSNVSMILVGDSSDVQPTTGLPVIANPSTWVRPSLDIAAPYGFMGISDRRGARRRFDAILPGRSRSCSGRRTWGRVILRQVRRPRNRAVRGFNAVRTCFGRRRRQRAGMAGHSIGIWLSFLV